MAVCFVDAFFPAVGTIEERRRMEWMTEPKSLN
jgi:hypothetical protein